MSPDASMEKYASIHNMEKKLSRFFEMIAVQEFALPSSIHAVTKIKRKIHKDGTINFRLPIAYLSSTW